MKKFLFIACLIFISSTAMYSNAPFCSLSLEDKVCQLEELQAEAATDQVMSLLEIMDESDRATLLKEYAHVLESLSVEQLSTMFEVENTSYSCYWVTLYNFVSDQCTTSRPDCKPNPTSCRVKKKQGEYCSAGYWTGRERDVNTNQWVCM